MMVLSDLCLIVRRLRFGLPILPSCSHHGLELRARSRRRRSAARSFAYLSPY